MKKSMSIPELANTIRLAAETTAAASENWENFEEIVHSLLRQLEAGITKRVAERHLPDPNP